MKYSGNTINLGFNPRPSNIMHIDLNSCFASVEQQANPHLRGKPIAVAAYTTPSGCILAPSVEAKERGVKTGMRVKDGKLICPDLIVLGPDPNKYRSVHLALRGVVSDYTSNFTPKSIDEFVLDLEGFLHLSRKTSVWCTKDTFLPPIHRVAMEIKGRIKRDIGEWLRVSIGIAPNRFLAKLASGLRKPDGLDEINKDNFLEVYSKLLLTDLSHIKSRNAIRLNGVGIYTVLDFYGAPLWKLKAAFESISSYYWYLRLRGWEIDDVEFGRRSYGNSYALPEPLTTPEELSPILSKLVTKMGARLRQARYGARGVHLSVLYRDRSGWHKGESCNKQLIDSRDIYKRAFKILLMAPSKKPVRELAVSCFGLTKIEVSQFELFDDVEKKEKLVKAVDRVNEYWGDFVLTPARMLNAADKVPDRIAFGGVKELEEFTLKK